MADDISIQEQAAAILREVFADAGAIAAAPAGSAKKAAARNGNDAVARCGDKGADIVVRAGGKKLVAQVKATGSTRLADLEGRLASAALQVIRYADQPDSAALVMIHLAKLGPKAIAFAADYMARQAPSVGWCLFDSTGAFRLEMAALGVARARGAQVDGRAAPLPKRESLFSDLNRWMLKILLLGDVAENLWGGPRQPVMSAKELRAAAKVSTEKAYSFLRMYDAAGYLRETSAGIVITRRGELMRTWLNHQRAFRRESVPVRSIFGPVADLNQLLLRRASPPEFAITGFEACNRLGVLHAPVPQREVCLHGNLESAIQHWELEKCDPRDADLLLARMPNPKSVLRGRVTVGGVPVVDVLEAALAVYGQAPRGNEQAAYIFGDVLGWEDCL